MTPVVIIAGAVFWTKHSNKEELTVANIFAILAIISLVSSPISQLISCLSNSLASVACFDRIQEYLMEEEINDSRSNLSQFQESTGSKDTTRSPLSPLIELVEMKQESSKLASNPNVVDIKDGSFTPAGEHNPVLYKINISIRRSLCTMIVGPVGSGKTTLLKVILGEISLSEGSIQIERNQIAYCNQTPWLRNISIQDNILGPNTSDDSWYTTVIRACALEKDIALLPNGDKTLVGSGGVALSGGQKHRVVRAHSILKINISHTNYEKALARAVYSRKPLLVLDDVLSALDNSTARSVFGRLLSKEGLLRSMGVTVILATHSGKLLNIYRCYKQTTKLTQLA